MVVHDSNEKQREQSDWAPLQMFQEVKNDYDLYKLLWSPTSLLLPFFSFSLLLYPTIRVRLATKTHSLALPFVLPAQWRVERKFSLCLFLFSSLVLVILKIIDCSFLHDLIQEISLKCTSQFASHDLRMNFELKIRRFVEPSFLDHKDKQGDQRKSTKSLQTKTSLNRTNGTKQMEREKNECHDKTQAPLEW